MRERLRRRLGATSVVALLVSAGLLLMGGLALAEISVSLYLEISTDEWDPWAPGPSGVAFNANRNTMYVVDSDRNNYDEFADGVDIWEINLNGTVVGSWGLGLSSTEEPTGIEYDPVANRMFVTNDDGDYRILMPGSDGVFGTSDDPAPSSPIGVAGSTDTEDPAYDPATDRLYVLNGGSSGRIYVLNPTTGAPLASPISLTGLGPSDWEGLALTPDGDLLVGANLDEEIHVLSTAGVPLQVINVAHIGLERISGLGISTPGAGGSGYDIWVADRQGTSNNDNPDNIDGRLWRLSTDGTPPPPTTTTTTTAPTTSTTTATTTTTTAPSTTTTTIPGGTTSTTLPGNPPGPEPDGRFADTSGHVFENAIAWLAEEGITQGCNPPNNTRFCPNDFVTRGQMAAFLVRAFGYTNNGGGDLFTDDNNSVFENAIDRLATAGVTVGCNPPANTRFCPDDFVTRGQMAAFLGRAFDYTDNGGGDWFIDDNGSVFENAIDRLRTAGVTQGCNPPANDRYCPNDFVTRGQMAAFVKRAFGA